MNAQSPLDGRPISGPAYPAWTDRVKVPEVANTDDFARDLLAARRLNVAAQLYAAALTGSGSLLDQAPARLAEQAVAHADRLIRANDAFRPAPPTATPAPAPSLSLAAVRLLAELCRRKEFPMASWETGVVLGPVSSQVERELLKLGLIAFGDNQRTIALTPDGIALMRGEQWDHKTPTSPAGTGAGCS